MNNLGDHISFMITVYTSGEAEHHISFANTGILSGDQLLFANNSERDQKDIPFLV
jgi:hypothetical protein